MLHYIRANSAGEGYQLLDFKVGEPRLLNREEIIQRALARCGTRELNKRTEAQLRAWCRGFFHRLSRPGRGHVDGGARLLRQVERGDRLCPYETCVRSGLADGDGLVDLPTCSAIPPAPAPCCSSARGNQYRLQHAEAFFAQYEAEAQGGQPA